MDIADTIYQHVKNLPVSKAIEVLDFVQFLQMRLDAETTETAKLSKPIQFEIDVSDDQAKPALTVEAEVQPKPTLTFETEVKPTRQLEFESEVPASEQKTAVTINQPTIELDDEFRALRDEWLSQ